MARSELGDWGSIPEVAVKAGVPKRSLYNWARAGKLETRKHGGQLLVNTAAASALASQRAAANGAGNAGTAPNMARGTGSGAPVTPENDGELSARVFPALKRGEALEDIIERMQLPAPVALALYDQFEKVRAAAKSGPSITERVSSLEKKMPEVAALSRATADDVAAIWQQLSLTQEMAEGVSVEMARVRPVLTRLTNTVRELVQAFRDEIAAR
jgi:hypothetical protein